jgi:hypothetical protein
MVCEIKAQKLWRPVEVMELHQFVKVSVSVVIVYVEFKTTDEHSKLEMIGVERLCAESRAEKTFPFLTLLGVYLSVS